ncbi:MAG TPA: acyloxyacyl hydrolase [Terracidiphilus sp.]|nr:acyloxyacyl hydrolase [Terracidiphilus sp.]
MRQSTFLFLLVLLLGTTIAFAETPAASDGDASTPSTPVSRARMERSWEMGPFINWGTGVGNRSDFKFFWGGFQLGKVITPVVHAGVFSGQFELSGNIMPLWQAYTPAPSLRTVYYKGQPYFNVPYGGGTFHGVAITPAILRWNFLSHSRRFQPWFQGAGGLIYTTHKFPPDQLVPHGAPGGTSVWNFAPQGGGGFHYFTRPGRSLDLGINAVHISSASLGDRNPGVNASIQIQVGYTFWQ